MPEAAAEKNRLSPAPRMRVRFSSGKMMMITAVSLMIPAAGGIIRYGSSALGVIAVTVVTALLAGVLCQKLRGQAIRFDGATLVTGLLLGLVLPPAIPLWMAAIGAIFAICIVKEAFGGTGQNIFNPAVGAQAFLLASFARPMSHWIEPTGFGGKIITGINPLTGDIGTQLSQTDLYQSLLIGNSAGYIGGGALFVIIGGLLLLLIGVIDIRMPLGYLAAVALTSLAFGADPVFNLLAGGVMIAAFYFACDPVTTPLYWKGKLIFAAGAGILTVLIRQLGTAPDGVAYAILIMNAVTPLIDRYIRPIPMGMKKAKRNEA